MLRSLHAGRPGRAAATATDRPHPWPDQIGAAHFGGEPVTITHADPAVVVKALADTAQSGGRRRHPLRFVRVRLD